MPNLARISCLACMFISFNAFAGEVGGIKFFGSDNAMISPPTFKNSQEAIEYGQTYSSSNERMQGLAVKREELLKQGAEMLENSKHVEKPEALKLINDAVVLITQGKLCREGLEASGHSVGSTFECSSIPWRKK